MDDLPSDLLAALPTAGVPAVRQWWAALAESERRQVAGLWDRRLEVRFFTPQGDDNWDQVPAVVGGRFIPPDDARGLADWGPGYFEYLLANPELVLAYEPARRTFHIGCTRHSTARTCIDGRRVPADFRCPLAAAACPLEGLRGACLDSGIVGEPSRGGRSHDSLLEG